MRFTAITPFSFTLKAKCLTLNANVITARKSYSLKPRENATVGADQISRTSLKRSALSIQRFISSQTTSARPGAVLLYNCG
jgi:hypothetical protein